MATDTSALTAKAERTKLTFFSFSKNNANRKVAFAYKLGAVKIYDTPRTLMDYGIKAAPQSFVYV